MIKKSDSLKTPEVEIEKATVNTDITAVDEWKREHGAPQYGLDKKGEFTGWIFYPDMGVKYNIYTQETIRAIPS